MEKEPEKVEKAKEINDEKDDQENTSKTVIPYKPEGQTDEDTAWDGSAAKDNIAVWAGGPDKENIDWDKYSRAFTYVDPENKENYGGYKLPHHDIVDGSLVTVLRGVYAAMAAVMGARGGVDVPENELMGIYNHLKKHYQQYGIENIPEFKSEKTEELKDKHDENTAELAAYKEEVNKELVQLKEDVKALDRMLNEILEHIHPKPEEGAEVEQPDKEPKKEPEVVEAKEPEKVEEKKVEKKTEIDKFKEKPKPRKGFIVPTPYEDNKNEDEEKNSKKPTEQGWMKTIFGK